MLPGVLLCLCLGPGQNPVEADVILKGGRVHDGQGKAEIIGDVALKGDKIVAIGTFEVAGSPRVIDVKGLIVAPGFIDLHTHSDYPLTREITRQNLAYLMQGVTTVVTGNCGSGPHEVAAWMRELEKGGIGSNVAHLVPHNDVRRVVMGNVNRPPTPAELKKMEDLVDKAMADGCWGLSTGLIYNPGTYAKTDELIALSRVAARHGGIYASHMRDEGAGLLASIEELLTIGREAGLPVHISHMKATGRKNWGKAGDAIALVEKARKAGQTVTADQYPYTASSTSLSATIVPTVYREGSAQDFLKRLDDPETGPKIRKALQSALDDKRDGADLRVSYYEAKPAWNGKSILEISKSENKTPLEIAVEILHKGGASIVNFGIGEEDMRLIMKQEWVATGSDGAARVPGGTDVPHPRTYGTFPRKIGRFCIEDKLIDLPQAIRSSSGLPADVLHLPERGYLKPGYFADVVVFDPETFRDKATFDKPHQYSTGVKYLFVNGKFAINDGKPSTTLAGRVLRHADPKP
jgi:N-acyl-D-aspartate/D-glutamate deacylase